MNGGKPAAGPTRAPPAIASRRGGNLPRSLDETSAREHPWSPWIPAFAGITKVLQWSPRGRSDAVVVAGRVDRLLRVLNGNWGICGSGMGG